MSLKDMQARRKVSSPGAPAGAGSAPRATILVIDDNADVLNALKMVLKLHYDVHVCHDPEEGVEETRRLKPDILVLDVKMPKHDGFWVLSEVRKFDTDVQVIFNSAYQETMAQGDASSIYKPFGFINKGSAKDFLQTIEECVAYVRRNGRLNR